MKVLLAILLVAVDVSAINMSSQPNKPANRKQSQPEIRNTIACASDTQQNANASEQGYRSGNGEPSKWYAAIKRPEWWLVIAAFITFAAVIWQAIATAGATKAMRKSVGLQETALQQWVDVVNWRTYLILLGGQRAGVKIKVDVVNPTGFPLTLKGAQIRFDNRMTFFFRDDCLLTPRNPYAVEVSLELTKGQYDYMYGTGLRIRVEGNLFHVGSLRHLQPQPFCGTLTCKDGQEPRFESETPTADAEQDTQRQT